MDLHGKKLFITLEGVDDKVDRAINKKKARELMDLADKVLISNYDYPKGSSGGIVPVSPMAWIKENFDFYCEVYSKAKLVPKLIMVINFFNLDHSPLRLLHRYLRKIRKSRSCRALKEIRG